MCCKSDGSWQARELGREEPHEVHQGEMQNPANWEGMTPCTSTCWKSTGLKTALQRGTLASLVYKLPINQQSPSRLNQPSVFWAAQNIFVSTGETYLECHVQFWSPHVQVRCGPPGTILAQADKDGEGIGTPLL